MNDLTRPERKQVLTEAAAILAARLYDETPVDELRLISKARAAGLLDVDSKTLDALGIPRISMTNGKLVKYMATDIAKFIASRREK